MPLKGLKKEEKKMGTNFYYRKRENCCSHCNRFDETEIHIGKRSYGVRFTFDPHFKTYKEWVEFIKDKDGFIFDEYGEEVSAKEMINDIFEWSGKTWVDESDGYYMDGKYMFFKSENFS